MACGDWGVCVRLCCVFKWAMRYQTGQGLVGCVGAVLLLGFLFCPFFLTSLSSLFGCDCSNVSLLFLSFLGSLVRGRFKC